MKNTNDIDDLNNLNDFNFLIERIYKYGGINRLGHIFTTDKNSYYYDNGTGKVTCLGAEEKQVFEWLFKNEHDCSYDNFRLSVESPNHDELLKNIRRFVDDENLLMAPVKTQFISPPHKEELESTMQSGMRILTLELTEECNLRCDYCIYNEKYDKVREFSGREMGFDTAKAAVDMLNKYGGEEVAITFYGGEPLLKFELIKQVIEYATETIKEKELTYSMTTNLTSMTREMAEFFVSIDGFSIVCSLDGSEDIHNEYRKYPNGIGSFNNAIKGLKYLVGACRERFGSEFAEKITSKIMLSMVFGPPYTQAKAVMVDDFFEEISDWLPKNISKTVTYPEFGSIDESIMLNKEKNDNTNAMKWDPLISWTMNEYDIQDGANELFTKKTMTEALLPIHNRPIMDKPEQSGGFNGCCIPGQRRAYVCTNGDILPCEKMGLCPTIGNVHNGFDIGAIAKHYVDDYEKMSISDCNECWAFNICGICYMKNYNDSSFDLAKKRENCISARNQASNLLRLYHHILETAPETLAYLNEIEVS